MAFVIRIVLLVALISMLEAPPVTTPCGEKEMLCHGKSCQSIEVSELRCDLICDCEISYDQYSRHVVPCVDETDCLHPVIIEETIVLPKKIDTVNHEGETYVAATG